MAGEKRTPKEVEQYTHDDKERVNNPPVGLVTPDTDEDGVKIIDARGVESLKIEKM